MVSMFQFWVMIGVSALVWKAGKLIRGEKQIAHRDHSYYRCSDSELFRLIFYFILWFLTGLGLVDHLATSYWRRPRTTSASGR